MTNFSKIALCAMVITAGAFTSCSKDDDAPAAKPSIYTRLGGTTLVADPDNTGQMIEQGRLSYRNVVDDSIDLIVADIVAGNNGNLSAHFQPLLLEVGAGNTSNIAVLSDNLTDFFSFNTGGTSAVNTYTGLDMVAAHKPGTGVGKNPRMGAVSTNDDFTRFEGFVGQAANMNGVAANTELYADIVVVLESLRAQTVQ